MKIVIFGGTSEGRELSRALAELGAEVTVSVATDYGSEQQGSIAGVHTLAGRLNAEEMVQMLSGAALCVDATHPYAVAVTAAAKAACAASGVPYRRLLRAQSRIEAGELAVADMTEAAAYLKNTCGNILLTTGAKELPAFKDLPPERLYPRILPSHQGISACEALGIPHRNIIAMQGPFSYELNLALLRQFDIKYLLTKDGGGPGGFAEKRRAACEAGARLILIRRPEDKGASFAQVWAECQALLK